MTLRSFLAVLGLVIALTTNHPTTSRAASCPEPAPAQYRQVETEAPAKVFSHGPEFYKRLQNAAFKIETERGSGTGWLYSDGIHIITNAHVVFRAHEFSAILEEGFDPLPLKLVGVDHVRDVAVLRAERKIPLHIPALIPHAGTVNVGDTVYAVGAPYGLDDTVTRGMVSHTNRLLEDFYPFRVYQVDATVVPGNSGGPLFDDKGRLIGMNFAGAGDSGNLSFVIPVPIIVKAVNGILHGDHHGEEEDPSSSD